MLAEGILSLVATVIKDYCYTDWVEPKKTADKKHRFGYGAELYFWAFIVAILIFAV